MMKKIIYTFILLSNSILFYAQQTSNLIVFSEDGLPFYLVLNGVRQNAKAETNIKVDGLSQPYYAAKIIFEDKTQPVLEKKVLQIQGAAETGPSEVTYKIKKNNKNVNVLRFYSQTPIAQAVEQPQNVTVVHYNTVPMPEITQVVTTQQTTTTSQTNENVNINMGVGMGVPSINMNVNINDPNVVHETKSTTVITTTSTHTQNYSQNNYTEIKEEPKGCHGNVAMSSSNFSAVKQTISNQKFDDTRLSTATQIINSNCLSSQQIKDMMMIFSFEDTRLKLAKLAHSKCTDPNNYFLLNDAFNFSSSVEELNNSIK